MKNWFILESKRQYNSALARIDELMDKNPSLKSEEGKELKLVLLLVERYEDEHYPIGSPDPIEAIKIRMDDLGLAPSDLIAAIGDKGTVSKVLSGKIALSLRMIRNLSTLLHLPAEVLIQEVKLKVA
jgi:HTH-type transcriptional regulator / antitoxin HigA